MLATSQAIVLPFGSQRSAEEGKRPNLLSFNNLVTVQAKSTRKTAFAFFGQTGKCSLWMEYFYKFTELFPMA